MADFGRPWVDEWIRLRGRPRARPGAAGFGSRKRRWRAGDRRGISSANASCLLNYAGCGRKVAEGIKRFEATSLLGSTSHTVTTKITLN
jgi:hypothetical protein